MNGGMYSKSHATGRVSLATPSVYSVGVVWCACCNRGHNAAETERRLKRG